MYWMGMGRERTWLCADSYAFSPSNVGRSFVIQIILEEAKM